MPFSDARHLAPEQVQKQREKDQGSRELRPYHPFGHGEKHGRRAGQNGQGNQARHPFRRDWPSQFGGGFFHANTAEHARMGLAFREVRVPSAECGESRIPPLAYSVLPKPLQNRGLAIAALPFLAGRRAVLSTASGAQGQAGPRQYLADPLAADSVPAPDVRKGFPCLVGMGHVGLAAVIALDLCHAPILGIAYLWCQGIAYTACRNGLIR